MAKRQNTLEHAKQGMQYSKEVNLMKTYSFARHLTTIMTVFAAIFLFASCAI